jgi:hypothetical protein
MTAEVLLDPKEITWETVFDWKVEGEKLTQLVELLVKNPSGHPLEGAPAKTPDFGLGLNLPGG